MGLFLLTSFVRRLGHGTQARMLSAIAPMGSVELSKNGCECTLIRGGVQEKFLGQHAYLVRKKTCLVALAGAAAISDLTWVSG
jgi:hypothetical protein